MINELPGSMKERQARLVEESKEGAPLLAYDRFQSAYDRANAVLSEGPIPQTKTEKRLARDTLMLIDHILLEIYAVEEGRK